LNLRPFKRDHCITDLEGEVVAVNDVHLSAIELTRNSQDGSPKHLDGWF
jgi:hypothetical protein